MDIRQILFLIVLLSVLGAVAAAFAWLQIRNQKQPNKTTKPMKSIPIIHWAARNWRGLAANAIFYALSQWDAAFEHAGMLIFAPLALTTALTLNSFAGYVAFRRTLDEDKITGKDVEEWKALDPRTRAILRVVIFAALFIGTCLVIASRK
jgi:hypothetical protein